MLLTNPVYLAAVLLLLVCLAIWLAEKKISRFLGYFLIVIIGAAIVAILPLP